MNLTIYSINYDNYSYVVGNGMSGKVFIEDGKNGKEFKTVDDALKFATQNKINLTQIVYCFQMNGMQYFQKFPFSVESATPKTEVL